MGVAAQLVRDDEHQPQRVLRRIYMLPRVRLPGQHRCGDGAERAHLQALERQQGQHRPELQPYEPGRAATKHVDVADHYIREQVERQRVSVAFCPTEEMIADIMTKPLPRPAFIRHRDKLVVPRRQKGN